MFNTGFDCVGLGSVERKDNNFNIQLKKIRTKRVPFKASVTKLGSGVGGGNFERSWSARDIFLTVEDVGPENSKIKIELNEIHCRDHQTDKYNYVIRSCQPNSSTKTHCIDTYSSIYRRYFPSFAIDVNKHIL